VRFFNRSGDDLTRDFQYHAENIQAFYETSGLEGLDLEVLDQETDYNRNYTGANLQVGFHFRLIGELGYRLSRGSMRFRLFEFPDGTKNGSTPAGGSELIDISMPFTIRALPGPTPVDRITRSVLTLESNTGETYVHTAANPNGLVNGAVSLDTLRVPQNLRFDGRIEFFDANGKDLTPGIRGEAEFFEVEPDVFIPMFTTLEQDDNGLPFGQTFHFDPETARIASDSFIRLKAFDPNFGGDKGFGTGGETLVEYRMVLLVGK
jgi:hypothetical protein